MSQGGAPVGNQNAVKNKPWADAIRKAIVQDPQKLAKLAEKLLTLAAEGDMQALKELGDRLDGRPKQIVGGDEDSPFKMLIGWMGQSKS